MNRWVAASMFCAALFFLTIGQASAHRVNIYAYEEGGKIHTESYFSDGTPSRDSHVTVYNEKGKVVVEGQTDGKGIFVFPVESQGDLRIVLEASMGHRNEILLPASEIGSGGAESVPDQDKKATSPDGDPFPAAVIESRNLLSSETIDRALDRRLKPIQASILRIQRAMEKPKLSQVLGGLGYIIGLAGALLWGMSRKKDI